MPAEARSRRNETIVKAVTIAEWVGKADGSRIALARALVDDIHAVAPAMATRDALRLPIQTHVKAHITELTHWVLHGEIRVHPATNRSSTLYAAVRSSTSWGQTRSLEGQDLVGCQLLLIQCLLLLLKGFNLILEGDL